MSDDLGNPEIPQPEKLPADEPAPAPKQDASSDGHRAAPEPEKQIYLDQGKLVEWMKGTDKQVRLLIAGQLCLSAAVLIIIFTVGKGAKIPSVGS